MYVALWKPKLLPLQNSWSGERCFLLAEVWGACRIHCGHQPRAACKGPRPQHLERSADVEYAYESGGQGWFTQGVKVIPCFHIFAPRISWQTTNSDCLPRSQWKSWADPTPQSLRLRRPPWIWWFVTWTDPGIYLLLLLPSIYIYTVYSCL